jgi:SAM-dependent methyltransferase
MFRIPYEESQIFDLVDPKSQDAQIAFLREQLALDERILRQGKLETKEAKQILSMPWFQRIYVDNLGIYTTSDHDRFGKDAPGELHTLFGALTDTEGSLLRPMAKWLYIEPLLPDVTGKSVLEIGSSCGFWSFKFAEKGASKVTGIEVIPEQVAAANHLAEIKNVKNRVSFLNIDAYYDKIEPHDIAFFSEVQGHSIVPFHSFLRTLGLAKELVIADDFFLWDETGTGLFYFSGGADQGKVIWTGYGISERTALDLCYLAGVPPRKVRRYRDGRGARSKWHTVLIVDVREAEQGRQAHLGHPSLHSMVEHAMGLR